ncbi:MAG: hypothetical protein OXK81_00085 [Chloroflexota bacterium]|nr:hypothetical protein [Chloroflexota bacterium]
MKQLHPLEGRVQVPLAWEVLQGQEVSEPDFIQAICQLPVRQLLPGLITLLQYGDSSEPAAYETLDRQICDLFPIGAARRIERKLSLESHWKFFSKWQLLFAIKLLCTFGSTSEDKAQVKDGRFLDFLLMTNGFYPSGEFDLSTDEGVKATVQRAALQGYSLIQHERPINLIGRYSELFVRLAAPSTKSEFNSWVDIQEVVKTKLGVQLDDFKAVLFALYCNSITGSPWSDDGEVRPRLGYLIPERYFADMKVPKDELNRILRLVATSPEQIRREHQATNGDEIGNPFDLGILLRKPAIALPDGRLAGMSGQLLIQRYTCGLYWDIHDALPDGGSAKPNRQSFQNFFGELHERYGRDILGRIRAEQLGAGRKVRLLSEDDYPPGSGSIPDNLVIETIGSRNTRCTMFEFKVGRPRYGNSIVKGDVQAFLEDLRLKIEKGLDQEIDFCQQVQTGQRNIPGLLTRNIARWFFVIVVSDPFPAMGVLLEPLRKKLASSAALGNTRRYGPFVLSLAELEQLETHSKSRISQLLIDWDSGPDRLWPFNTFYANRTKGQPIGNNHVEKLAEDDMARVTNTLFGHSIQPRQPTMGAG